MATVVKAPASVAGGATDAAITASITQTQAGGISPSENSP